MKSSRADTMVKIAIAILSHHWRIQGF